MTVFGFWAVNIERTDYKIGTNANKETVSEEHGGESQQVVVPRSTPRIYQEYVTIVTHIYISTNSRLPSSSAIRHVYITIAEVWRRTNCQNYQALKSLEGMVWIAETFNFQGVIKRLGTYHLTPQAEF